MTQPHSSNRAKAIRRLSRQHARIADVRRNFLHEVSSQLVQTHDRLCMEDLMVSNLMTNPRLARAISDAAWTELARQLTYKAAWFGAELVVCDRWFASTKTCSGCGIVKQQMGLAERIFRCAGCGLAIDRDRKPPLTSPPGASAPMPRPRTAKRTAGQSTPRRGGRWPSPW
jgi:putative transposase